MDGGPIDLEVLLSPFNFNNIDFEMFGLVIDEIRRMPVDQGWSMKTAINSYLRNASLEPRKYDSDRGKVKLYEHLSKGWRERPICSSVAPRFWQKYLLKLAV